MSAWLCGNKTLSLCVDVIKSDEYKEKYDLEKKYSDKDPLEILTELSNLNTKSLNCRYGFHESNILKDKKYIPLSVDEGQKYKSVHCYLYQTCECKENYEHPLFKGLTDWCEDNFEKYEFERDNYYWDIDNPL